MDEKNDFSTSDHASSPYADTRSKESQEMSPPPLCCDKEKKKGWSLRCLFKTFFVVAFAVGLGAGLFCIWSSIEKVKKKVDLLAEVTEKLSLSVTSQKLHSSASDVEGLKRRLQEHQENLQVIQDRFLQKIEEQVSQQEKKLEDKFLTMEGLLRAFLEAQASFESPHHHIIAPSVPKESAQHTSGEHDEGGGASLSLENEKRPSEKSENQSEGSLNKIKNLKLSLPTLEKPDTLIAFFHQEEKNLPLALVEEFKAIQWNQWRSLPSLAEELLKIDASLNKGQKSHEVPGKNPKQPEQVEVESTWAHKLKSLVKIEKVDGEMPQEEKSLEALKLALQKGRVAEALQRFDALPMDLKDKLNGWKLALLNHHKSQLWLSHLDAWALSKLPPKDEQMSTLGAA